ncbi:MAG: VOC family protein [Cyclobacteriaceae bacterium]
MQIDHIFIFSSEQGREADELIQFGLVEGSNRIHPGQGTRNRKFYFKNFFLELVWVSNENEIKSPATAPTRLWERANYKINGYSPFGLCMEPTDDVEELFEGCLKYSPDYISDEQTFEIITQENSPQLPWACRVPHASEFDKLTDHPNGLQKLSKVTFGVKGAFRPNRFTEVLSSKALIEFENNDDHCLTLEFDEHRTGQTKHFDSLPLVIVY